MTNEEKKKSILEAFWEIIDRMDDEELELYYQASTVLIELKKYIPTGQPN